VYTALSDLDSIEFFYRSGANLYVVKPSSFAELRSALEKIFAINWKKVMYYPTLSQFVLKAS
jgi:hypothetical protein